MPGLLLFFNEVSKIASCFHHPGNSHVHEQSSDYGLCFEGQHAKDQSPKITADAFRNRFTKMDHAIKSSHRKNGILPHKMGKRQHNESAKKNFDSKEIYSV